MADTGIFATTAEVQRKAGAGASSTATAEAYINDFMTQAESQINAETTYNWSDAYSGLNVDVKGILKLAASNLAAIYCLNYDLTGMTASEAQTRLDILWSGYKEAVRILSDKNTQKFITGA